MREMRPRSTPRVLMLMLLPLGALAPAGSAWAQAAPAATADSPIGYVDREIDGLAPEAASDDTSTPYNRAGWPRFLRLETRLGTRPFDPERQTRLGYGVYGLLETPNHGTLSVEGSYAPRDSSGTLTLRQRGLPVAGGWLVGNELGVINPPTPDILRLPSRLYLPSAIVQGLSTDWRNAARGLQLQASAGEPGLLEFQPSSGFRRLTGKRATLGGQWQLTANEPGALQRRGWTLAVQHEDARRVAMLDQPDLSTDHVDARSTLLALRHETDDHRMQGQVLQTQASNVKGARSGAWIDSEWDDGPRRHGAGAYRLEPDLSWAHLPLANDLVGAYARTSWRTRQWSAEGSIDWLDSITGRSSSGIFATASARWRVQRGHTLGAGATVRRFDGDAWSTFVDWRFQNSWGTSGLRVDLTQGDREARASRLTWDQEWPVPQGWSLATSLASDAVEASENRPAERIWSAALSVAAPLSSTAALRGNLSSEHGDTGPARHSVNLGANWRVAPRWSLELQYNRFTGSSRVLPSLDPLAPISTVVPRLSDRSFYAVLRYEIDAGSRDIPLGGRATEGGGRIEGTVYFDGNRSGTQEASETGAPNVMVYLDNRYAVRTDSQGRFEFPFVATGPRTVTVRNETLPLPWTVIDEGQVRVDVRLRESTRLSIGVQRSE